MTSHQPIRANLPYEHGRAIEIGTAGEHLVCADLARLSGGPATRLHRTLATVDSAARGAPRILAADGYYREPPWAVEGLFDVQRFAGTIWDPACGRGTIPEICRARGHRVIATDLRDRGYGKTLDFLAGRHKPVDNIVCNPPFDLAEAFLRQALRTARHKVAFLLRFSWAESAGRRWIWDETPLAAVHPFAHRVSMPPGDLAIEAKGGAVCFAWWLWSHDHPRVGDRWAPPIIARIERAKPRAEKAKADPPTEDPALADPRPAAAKGVAPRRPGAVQPQPLGRVDRMGRREAAAGKAAEAEGVTP